MVRLWTRLRYEDGTLTTASGDLNERGDASVQVSKVGTIIGGVILGRIIQGDIEYGIPPIEVTEEMVREGHWIEVKSIGIAECGTA